MVISGTDVSHWEALADWFRDKDRLLMPILPMKQ